MSRIAKLIVAFVLCTCGFIAITMLEGCSGEPLPPVRLPAQVPAELLCKTNLLLRLPRDPNEIDFNAVKDLIEGVRGCDAIHFDAGQ